MKTILKNFHQEESGQGLVEYVLIIALIALAATAAMSGLASTISNAFTAVGSKMSSATS